MNLTRSEASERVFYIGISVIEVVIVMKGHRTESLSS